MTVFEYILLGLWLSAMVLLTVRRFSRRGRWSASLDTPYVDVDVPVHHHHHDHGHHGVFDHIDFGGHHH